MIESVTIANTATFGMPPEVLTGLPRFNYLFGSNGTGGKKVELAQVEMEFQEKCWSQKQKHDEKLRSDRPWLR